MPLGDIKVLEKFGDKHAKAYFEIHYETVVSDRTWYRIKRMIRDTGLEINRDNLRFIAELKKRNENTKMSLAQTLYCYQQAREIAKSRITVKGDAAYQELQRLSGYKAHRTTIIRWFQSGVSKVEGKYFDRQRIYKAEELVIVFAFAFMYKTKKASKKVGK